MPATTIKVPSELRDRLNAEARKSNATVATVIETLIAERDRVDRFRVMRAERGTVTPEERVAFDREDADWESVAIQSLNDGD
jgi:predicted transcriptional regulator